MKLLSTGISRLPGCMPPGLQWCPSPSASVEPKVNSVLSVDLQLSLIHSHCTATAQGPALYRAPSALGPLAEAINRLINGG